MASAPEDLIRKIKVLNDTIWEGRATQPRIDNWLDNFPDFTPSAPNERLHALYLLSNFLYFGDREIREMLKSIYRDKYKYPIVERIRRSNHNTTDSGFIKTAFTAELSQTRFLGMGNPSESGCHLLYYFRQENALPKDLFIHTHQIFVRQGTPGVLELRDPHVTRYVFIDDFCGSGGQASRYSQDLVQDIKRLNKLAHVSYYVLFATEKGTRHIRDNTLFDSVDCIYELDKTFKCFDPHSRYFSTQVSGDPSENIDKAFAHSMCEKYGIVLCPIDPLGYGDCQLLLAFHHNTPDNTLPIFWCEGTETHPWKPMFKRYEKIYRWLP